MDRDFWLGLRHPRLAQAIWSAKKWWAPYGPSNNAERVKALKDACVYFHQAQMIALAERDQRQVAIDHALSAMRNSEYVGGPSEREAWQTALRVLGVFETHHQGVEASALEETRP